jgi:hypothetical protein
MRRGDAVYVLQIGETYSRVYIIHMEFVPPLGHIVLETEILPIVVALVAINTVPAKQLGAIIERVGRQKDESTVTARHVLDGLETKNGNVIPRSDVTVIQLASKCVSTVLDHARTETNLDRLAV